MPLGKYGQLITISVELDLDSRAPNYIWVHAKRNQTIAQIAASRGHPELAQSIAKLNKIASIYKKLKANQKIKVPGNLRQDQFINVLPQDQNPPVIKGGYATFDTIASPGRKGLSRFTGYDPTPYDVPIAFENFSGGDGRNIENDITELERLAGRGHFAGSAVGPPAVIRLSCTDNTGQQVHLIPGNYQWSRQNPTAPLWRINGIDWSDNPSRALDGRRIRESAVLHLVEYTPITLQTRSATARWKASTIRDPSTGSRRSA